MTKEYELDLKLSSVGSLLDMIRANLIQPRIYKHLENGIPTNFGDVFDIDVSHFKYFEVSAFHCPTHSAKLVFK